MSNKKAKREQCEIALEDWKTRCDFDVLMQASRILQDAQRMSCVKNLARKEIKDIARFTLLKVEIVQ